MKRALIILVLFLNSAFGVNLINHEVFEKSYSVDLVLYFDSSYTPNISQRIDGNDLVVTLKNVLIDEKFSNQIQSKIINNFSISPDNDKAEIRFKNAKELKIKASYIEDNFSLTLTIKNPSFSQINVAPVKEEQNLALEKNDNITSKLTPNIIILIVIAIIIVLLLLLALKVLFSYLNRKKKEMAVWKAFDEQNKVNSKSKTNNTNQKKKNIDVWDIFDKQEEKNQLIEKIKKEDEKENKSIDESDMKITFHSNVDDENKFAIIKAFDKKYIILLNDENLLPDDFPDKPTSMKDFIERLSNLKNK